MAALLLAASVLTACTNSGNKPSDTTPSGSSEVTDGQTKEETKKETEAVTLSEEETYKRNPKLSGAYLVDGKTVRVAFDSEVYCPEFDFKDYTYV